MKEMEWIELFLRFCCRRRFSIHKDVALKGVMDGMEATNESSLSGGVYSQYISAAIEQRHLYESISYLCT